MGELPVPAKWIAWSQVSNLIHADDVARLIGVMERLIEAAVATESTSEFLRQQLPEGPSCVLLDMCMNGMTGLEVQDALRRNERRVPIVFLSGHGTVSTAVTTVRGPTKRARSSTWPCVSSPAMPRPSHRTFLTPR